MQVKFKNKIFKKHVKNGQSLNNLCFEIFKYYLADKSLDYSLIQEIFNPLHCTSKAVVLSKDDWKKKPQNTKERYFPPIKYNDMELYFSTEWGNNGITRGKDCDNINHVIHFAKEQGFDIEILEESRDTSASENIDNTKTQEKLSLLKPIGSLTFPHKNILLKGVPGTGKSRAIENIINNKLELKDHKENILRINIHSASSNADLMQGIGISSSDGKIEYKEKQGLILDIIQRATFKPNQPFVLILEEIQENSLNELIGDLIYLIEEDKRAKNVVADGEAYAYQELVEKIIEDDPSTDYVEIPYLVNDSTEYRKMIMPNNLYIFCTSNYRDDKKVIEDNLLRRFEVLEVYPREGVAHEYCREFFKALNENILTVLKDEIHPDRFLIGHAIWKDVSDKPKFYRAFLKVVVEFKDIKEVEFDEFKKIVKELPMLEELDLSSYKALIEDLQNKAEYDFLD